MKTAICLQHAEYAGLGILEWALQSRGIEIDLYYVPRTGVPPAVGDVLVLLGGVLQQTPNDQSWMENEIEYVRRAVAEKKPVLAFGLGAQVVTQALGGTTYRGPKPEIGMTTIHLTPEGRADPVFGQITDPIEVFEWHHDGINPPAQAVIMAYSEAYPVQAFRYGDNVVALLFHTEVDRTDVDRFCAHRPSDVHALGLTSSSILQKAKLYLPVLHRWTETLIDSLLRV